MDSERCIRYVLYPFLVAALAGGCTSLKELGIARLAKKVGVPIEAKIVAHKPARGILTASDLTTCKVSEDKWWKIDRGDTIACVWSGDQFSVAPTAKPSRSLMRDFSSPSGDPSGPARPLPW